MLPRKKLRLREAKWYAQDHTLDVWQSWDWSPRLSLGLMLFPLWSTLSSQ